MTNTLNTTPAAKAAEFLRAKGRKKMDLHKLVKESGIGLHELAVGEKAGRERDEAGVFIGYAKSYYIRLS